MTKRTLLFVVLLAVTSCTSFNAPLDTQLDLSDEAGMAVFSLTSEGVLSNFFLRYRGESNGDVTQWTVQNPRDWESNPRGRLVVLKLPVGEYEFYELRTPLTVVSEKDFSIPFEVRSGRVTYLGNVSVIVPDYERFSIQVFDAFERDIALFLSRYRNISAEDVDRRLGQVGDGT